MTKSYHLCRIDNQITSVAAVAVSAIWHQALSHQSENARCSTLSHTEQASERAKLSFPSTTQSRQNAMRLACAVLLLVKCARWKIDIVGVLGVENIHCRTRG